MNTATDTVIVIRCDTCTYRLLYPAFFLAAKKPALQKIFKWTYRYSWQNCETIEFMEREFPNIVATVEAQGNERIATFAQRLQECTAEYERDFLDPDPATFPKGMTKDEIRSERQARKNWNAVRKQQVKKAEADYEKEKSNVKNEIKRAKQVYELFLSEKRII